MREVSREGVSLAWVVVLDVSVGGPGCYPAVRA